jgi:hypothetical protein
MVWYGMVWYGMVWYGMVWYGMSIMPLISSSSSEGEEGRVTFFCLGCLSVNYYYYGIGIRHRNVPTADNS